MNLEDRVRNNIRKLQWEKKLTYQDLANILFISMRTMQKRMLGIYKLNISDIEMLCDHFGLPYDYFFREVEPQKPYIKRLQPLQDGADKVTMDARRRNREYYARKKAREKNNEG